MWLTRISVYHPVFAAMLMLALMVLGLFSLKQLPVEQFPDVKFPFAIVSTSYPGASPEVVESEVSKKLEETLNTISGVKTIRSISNEGQSIVIIEFTLSTDIFSVLPEVRDKVAQVKSSFKDEVKDPVITRWNPDDLPFTALAMSSSSRSLRELTELADKQVTKRLQAIAGMGSARIMGGEKRQIQILLHPDQLQAYGLGVNEVVQALRQDNQNWPAGSLTIGPTETLVELKGRVANLQALEELVVGMRAGVPVLLRQVADVADAAEEPSSRALVDGEPALAIELLKVQGANTIALVDDVRHLLQDLQRQLPPDIKLQLVGDTSRGIRNAVADVRTTLLEGAALTIVIVLVFLGSWRSTIITGLALPVALVGTLWSLKLFGFTINTMTLLALSLCVGLLIDDAIVVRENIMRHLHMGKTPFQAALDGTQEIGLAVLATTLTIVAVFLPVGFMGGIIGRFFYQFGLTVASAVLISLLVAFTLDPMLSSIWPEPIPAQQNQPQQNHVLARGNRAFQAWLEKLNHSYARIIVWALDHRGVVLLLASVCLLATLGLAGMIGKEFVPQPDLSEFNIRAETPPGSSLEYTTSKAADVSRMLRRLPEVQSVYASNTKTQMYLKVLLVPKQQRQRKQAELMAQAREQLQQVHALTLSTIQAAGSAGGDDKLIRLSVQGPDLRVLTDIATQLQEKLAKIPGLVDLESSLKPGKPTYAVYLDREAAARFGVDLNQLNLSLRPLLAGEDVSVWQAPDGETYPMTVRLPASARENAQQLKNLPVRGAAQAELLSISQITHIESLQSASKINRKSLFREVLLTANALGRPAGDVAADIKAIRDQFKLPAGYRFEEEGSNKDMQESIGYAVQALLLAVIFIYLILASQFNSLLHPVAIMASLPFALIGVLLALLLWRSTLNIFSIIGVIMLMGLVTKNAILLVDFIEQATRQGMAVREAIIESGRVRLRPILMTTFAMIFGMLPLALGLGEGAEQRAPMAHAVIGGVITSTLLTLVVVPVIYTYLNSFESWFLSKLKRA